MKKVRTNIVLDDDLIKEIMKFSDERTKREVVEVALHEHLRMLKRKKLASLRGKIKWEGNLEQMRRGRS